MIKNPCIKLKEVLDKNDYDTIKKLQDLCLEVDRTSLKLELDYKLGRAAGKSGALSAVNEFMYFNDGELIGYIGINHYGGDELEVNGMVHPGYRRRGVFKRLFSMIKEEWYKRKTPKMLLLSDHESDSGLGFVKFTGAEYDFSEYEMCLKRDIKETAVINEVQLIKAGNEDAQEVARIDCLCFDEEYKEEEILLPEEEEKGGMAMYIAKVGNTNIGKVNLETSGSVYGIYGLGVLPEYRGQGYGRGILMRAVEKLKTSGPNDIMLQVAVENENALNLYKSCGFEVTSKMDYYRMLKG